LRHACASLLLVQGVHPRVVMEILGHSQISLTMNTYSHVIPELGHDAAKRMDDLFAGTWVPMLVGSGAMQRTCSQSPLAFPPSRTVTR